MVKTIEKLEEYTLSIPARFLALDESLINDKPDPHKWSKKEIFGHLIDSAINNLQRIIRVQYEPGVKIVYSQNDWVSIGDYQHLDTESLIQLWISLNRQFIRVVKRFPTEKLASEIDTGKSSNELHTAEFLITDYLAHMGHHLSQIFNQNKIN
jgi:hypothetical protein